MARRYFTSNKSGEEVEVSRELALELMDAGKKQLSDFEFEDDEDTVEPVAVQEAVTTPDVQIQTTAEGITLPEQGELSPIEMEEQKFQETVVPQQQVAQQAREQAATERRARREAGELTTGESIEDVLFTRDVTEGAAPGSQALAEVGALTSLPARALGSLFGFGDISEESTKILKPAIEAVNEWTNSPEDPSIMRQAAGMVANVVLETVSDPTAIISAGARNVFRAAAKKAGKNVSKKQLDDFVVEVQKKADENIAKAGRKAGATDIKAEELLVESGGAEAVVQRLEKEGIGVTTVGERVIPQTKMRETVEKLKTVPIEEFNITDKIEATVVPIKKKSFLTRALRGNVKGKANDVADALDKAGENVAEIHDILVNAGFKDPGLVDNASGIISRLKGDITGAEARDLIKDLNQVIGDPAKARTGTKIQLMKLKEGIESELKKAVGDAVPDDALQDYLTLREAGTGKFATKTGKLANIAVRNPDKTINEAKSIAKMDKMINDAMSEYSRGVPGVNAKNLDEIDELLGTNMSQIAKDKALADRFQLDIKGEIGAQAADVKAPPSQSIIEAGIVGGPGLAKVAAFRNIGTDIINKSNKKKIIKLVNTISKQKRKVKLTEKRIKELKTNMDAGKKFLMSEIDGGRGIQVFDAMLTAGLVTMRELVQGMSEEDVSNVIQEASNSSDNKVRAFGKKLEKEVEKGL